MKSYHNSRQRMWMKTDTIIGSSLKFRLAVKRLLRTIDDEIQLLKYYFKVNELWKIKKY